MALLRPRRRGQRQRGHHGLDEGVAQRRRVAAAERHVGEQRGRIPGRAGQPLFGARRRGAGGGKTHRRRQHVQIGRGVDALEARRLLLLGRGPRAHRHFAEFHGHTVHAQQHRRVVVGVHQNLVGLHQAVHEAGLVQRLERIEQLVVQAHQAAHRRRVGALQALLFERLAFDVRHQSVDGAVGVDDAEDLDNARMIDSRQRPRVLNESLADHRQRDGVAGLARAHRAIGLADRQRARETLEQHQRLLVARLAHAVGEAVRTLVQRLLDDETIDAHAGRQRHHRAHGRGRGLGKRQRGGRHREGRLRQRLQA